MDLFFMIPTTVMVPIWYIVPSRMISMTFKTFSRSITIKNENLAKMIIAEKILGITTDSKKIRCRYWV